MQYKLCSTVHRCLQHKAPQYMKDCCIRTSDIARRQHLRSASCRQLLVPRHRRSMFGRSVVGPCLWPARRPGTSVSVKEIFQRVADARCLRLGSQSEKLSESLTPYLFIFGVALSNIKYQSLCCRNGVTLMVEITEYGCY